ncbi:MULTISPECIES: hypothetical protein [unclassified Pseudomonas]|uniref:DUF5983 family protein n=1 Tax=unclassified Pseudomonas TaxID=196821 RepID=UPI00211F3AF0|nr:MULTISPECIES: hypothetical protein [unclassified Pseudomonas]
MSTLPPPSAPGAIKLPNEAINFQPCVFDDDCAVIPDGQTVAHLPTTEFEYLQERAWQHSPTGFFECFELRSSHAVGCKLYSTPWSMKAEGHSSCSADEVSARMRDDHVPPVLLQLLLLAGYADTRLLIFDPDAAPPPELPLFTED